MLHIVQESVARWVGARMRAFGKKMFHATDAIDSLSRLELLETTTPTLYIHVPFCHAPLCGMCPFCRQVFKRGEAERYVHDLRAELARYKHLQFPSVYIGGGTPSTLLTELMELVHEYSIGGDELSIEAHPADLSASDLEIMVDAGVTRLSVGVQSFDNQLLKQMGRSNGVNPVEHLRAAQQHFVVNADLIYNFTGQTIEQFVRDLDILIEIGVSQITCYPLMPAPDKFQHVDDASERQYYHAMLERLKTAGYAPLTPWAFTRSPQESQGEYISNSGGEQYLGVGASSISKLGALFTINAFNLDQYHQLVQDGQFPVIGVRKLRPIEDAHYFLLTSLFGMRLDMSTLAGNQYRSVLLKTEVQALRMLGLVVINDSIAQSTEAGMLFFSKVMKDFYTGLNFFRAELKNGTNDDG